MEIGLKITRRGVLYKADVEMNAHQVRSSFWLEKGGCTSIKGVSFMTDTYGAMH
jgi:hypothetical protein